jgi:endonuclease VIII
MPEGDTIHHAAARIRAVIEGRVPDEILTPQARHRLDRWPQALAGRQVRSVDAHGKHLFVRFGGGLTLHSHLRMSGSWRVQRVGERWRRAADRAWIVIRSDGWEIIEFDGPVLELMRDTRTRTHPQLAALGQDVLGQRFDMGLFLTRLRAGDPARPIGEALLDQQTVAGIGNLWKTESCFATGVDPWRTVAEIADEEARALLGFAREQMAVCAREGMAARPRAVYGRAGRPCPRCGTAIRRRAQGENNRVTFWCPGCQT